MDTVDSNTCAIDSFCDPLYSQSLCMGKTIIICYSIWYVLCTDCHVVWCLYTIGVCWCCFWSSSSYDGSSCTNTSDPTSNPWSALVLGIAYQHACWWIDAFCRHLYRAFLHLQVHLEWSVLLHVWLFDTRIPNPGGDNCGNCYCHYLFQFMQRGKFDQGSCHDNPSLWLPFRIIDGGGNLMQFLLLQVSMYSCKCRWILIWQDWFIMCVQVFHLLLLYATQGDRICACYCLLWTQSYDLYCIWSLHGHHWLLCHISLYSQDLCCHQGMWRMMTCLLLFHSHSVVGSTIVGGLINKQKLVSGFFYICN